MSPLRPVRSRVSLMISYLTIVSMGYVELLLLIPSLKIYIILYDIKIITGRCVLLIETFVNFRTNDMLQPWGLVLWECPPDPENVGLSEFLGTSLGCRITY